MKLTTHRENAVALSIIAFGIVVSGFVLTTSFMLQAEIQRAIAENTFKEFTKNLTFDSVGRDVKELQKFLNSDVDTRVAKTGIGSPGLETIFFGPKTYAAVIKFQNKYADEVLKPLGLRRPTGFVGPATRRKLNELYEIQMENNTKNQFDPNLNLNEAQSELLESLAYEGPVIGFISTHTPTQGERVRVTGMEFSKDSANIIHFFGKAPDILGVSSVDGKSLSFVIPKSMPFGKYRIRIDTPFEDGINSRHLIVQNPEVEAPKIDRITPTHGKYGTEITVQGSGFLPTGNDIYTSIEIIENVSSIDGATLSFVMEPYKNDPRVGSLEGIALGNEFPIYFFVINDNGQSDTINQALFTLEL